MFCISFITNFGFMKLGHINKSSLDELIEVIKKESCWYESNERFVIVEKYESNICVVRCDGYNKKSFRFITNNNEIHRNNGNPSFISDDMIMWHKNGKTHRNNDRPAIKRKIRDNPFHHGIYNFESAYEEYFINGLRHRDYDLPAVIFKGEITHLLWFQNGNLHRDNNMPSIINGNFLYYHTNGQLYKSEFYYKNKLANWILKHPFTLSIILFFMSIIIISCF